MKRNNRNKSNYMEHVSQLIRNKKMSSEKFHSMFLSLNNYDRAKVIIDLPNTYRKDLLRMLTAQSIAKFVNLMRTDDATDLMIMLKDLDEVKWLITIEELDTKLTESVNLLMDYTEEESGSLMQIEIFTVTKDETISDSMNRLRVLIDKHSFEHITNVFLVDAEYHLIALFSLATIATVDDTLTYEEIYNSALQPIAVYSRSSINESVRLMTRYNLHVLPVINKNGRLLGRITHDDILDYVQDDATKQIYSLNQIHSAEEIEASVIKTGRDRALWLFINLINATLVSIIISFFEYTLQQVVALAVLMPIVANMAGTASMQTLTVVVRQMALGNINWGDATPMLSKEVKIAFFNGLLFSILATIISYIWFSSWYIGAVMAASMFVTFIFAGILGAYVPLALKAVKIDPAIASSVIVITLVDMIGFFSFLWFATLWIPEINI